MYALCSMSIAYSTFIAFSRYTQGKGNVVRSTICMQSNLEILLDGFFGNAISHLVHFIPLTSFLHSHICSIQTNKYRAVVAASLVAFYFIAFGHSFC